MAGMNWIPKINRLSLEAEQAEERLEASKKTKYSGFVRRNKQMRPLEYFQSLGLLGEDGQVIPGRSYTQEELAMIRGGQGERSWWDKSISGNQARSDAYAQGSGYGTYNPLDLSPSQIINAPETMLAGMGMGGWLGTGSQIGKATLPKLTQGLTWADRGANALWGAGSVGDTFAHREQMEPWQQALGYGMGALAVGTGVPWKNMKNLPKQAKRLGQEVIANEKGGIGGLGKNEGFYQEGDWRYFLETDTGKMLSIDPKGNKKIVPHGDPNYENIAEEILKSKGFGEEAIQRWFTEQWELDDLSAIENFGQEGKQLIPKDENATSRMYLPDKTNVIRKGEAPISSREGFELRENEKLYPMGGTGSSVGFSSDARGGIRQNSRFLNRTKEGTGLYPGGREMNYAPESSQDMLSMMPGERRQLRYNTGGQGRRFTTGDKVRNLNTGSTWEVVDYTVDGKVKVRSQQGTEKVFSDWNLGKIVEEKIDPAAGWQKLEVPLNDKGRPSIDISDLADDIETSGTGVYQIDNKGQYWVKYNKKTTTPETVQPSVETVQKETTPPVEVTQPTEVPDLAHPTVARANLQAKARNYQRIVAQRELKKAQEQGKVQQLPETGRPEPKTPEVQEMTDVERVMATLAAAKDADGKPVFSDVDEIAQYAWNNQRLMPPAVKKALAERAGIQRQPGLTPIEKTVWEQLTQAERDALKAKDFAGVNVNRARLKASIEENYNKAEQEVRDQIDARRLKRKQNYVNYIRNKSPSLRQLKQAEEPVPEMPGGYADELEMPPLSEAEKAQIRARWEALQAKRQARTGQGTAQTPRQTQQVQPKPSQTKPKRQAKPKNAEAEFIRDVQKLTSEEVDDYVRYVQGLLGKTKDPIMLAGFRRQLEIIGKIRQGGSKPPQAPPVKTNLTPEPKKQMPEGSANRGYTDEQFELAKQKLREEGVRQRVIKTVNAQDKQAPTRAEQVKANQARQGKSFDQVLEETGDMRSAAAATSIKADLDAPANYMSPKDEQELANMLKAWNKKNKTLKNHSFIARKAVEWYYEGTPGRRAFAELVWGRKKLSEIEDKAGKTFGVDPFKAPKEGITTVEGARLKATEQLPDVGKVKGFEEVLKNDPNMKVDLPDKVDKVSSKFWLETLDTLDTLRVFVAGGEFSAVGRQGLFASIHHPLMAKNSIGAMFRAFKSEEVAQQIDNWIRTGDNAKITALADKHGVVFPPIKDNALDILSKSRREEMFTSNRARKIPFVRTFERAYVTFLNMMRFQIWKEGLKQLEKSQAKALAKPNSKFNMTRELDQLGSYVNVALGRSDLMEKQLGKAMPFLTHIFFAPRFNLSLLQRVGKTFNPTTSAYVRKQLIQDMAGLLTAGAVAIKVAEALGAKVTLDPRDTDFAKLQFGDTKLDIWGGYVKYVRLISRLRTGKTISGGQEKDIDTLREVNKFIQGMLAPGASLALDTITGEDYIGNKMFETGKDVQKQIFKRTMPMAYQDILEAAFQEPERLWSNPNLNENWIPQTLASLTALGGVGAVTYNNEPTLKTPETNRPTPRTTRQPSQRSPGFVRRKK